MVEFLVAVALAALIAMSVRGFVSSAARLVATREVPQDALIRQGCFRVLEYDLANAESFAQDAGSVRLRGHAGLDGAPPQPAHRPVEVVYTVQGTPAGTVLLRRQYDRLRPSNRPERTDVVAYNVRSVRLGSTVTSEQTARVQEANALWENVPVHATWLLEPENRGTQR